MNKTSEQKRSAASWLMELAQGRRGEYALSIFAALLGVACSLIPYFIIIKIITALVNGTAELSRCLVLCAWMAGFWVLRYVLHSVSTSLSHHATFCVLANTRTRLLDKLATLPLGTVLDRSSGSYKNIIVERVDSIETTLAHLLPEMTANIVGALAVLVLLFTLDWRMGLSMFIVLPLGILCFMSMFSGYNEKFQRTVTSTKALNDTAVEMTNGSYTFNTGRFSPAAFIDQSNLSVAYTTLYKVRIEGAKIDMGAGTPFVKVEGKAENETVLVEPTEKMLYKDAEGQDNMFYDSVPYYTDGNVWYFMADDGLADIAILVNFSGIPDRSLYYILEVKYEENGGATDNAGFDLTGAHFVSEYGETDSYYVHLSSKKEIISLYACITMASGVAPDITDSENCYQVILCFSASAGSSISGVFR